MKLMIKLMLTVLLLTGIFLFSSCSSVKINLEMNEQGIAAGEVVSGYPIVFSQVYAAGENNDTPVRYSFIELTNTGDEELSLAGMTLQYAPGDRGMYIAYPFAKDAVIGAGEHFLIRCAPARKEGEAYLDSCEKFSLTAYDWDLPDLVLSNKNIRLMLCDGKNVLDNSAENLWKTAKVKAYFGAKSEGQSSTLPVMSAAMTKNTVIRRNADHQWEALNYNTLDCRSISEYTPVSRSGRNDTIPLGGVDVLFSVPGGKYKETQTITLETLPGYDIYYTTDCAADVTQWTKYTGPFTVKENTDFPGPLTTQVDSMISSSHSAMPTEPTLRGTVVRACVFDGENYGDIQHETYFISPKIANFRDIFLINITVDVDAFAGSAGIYTTVSKDIFAERGRCNGYMELMEGNGTPVGEHYVQLAMNGNGSLGFRQKSMRVYVRETETVEDGATLYYDLFDGHAVNSDGEAIDEYKRFLLRNSGNDCSQAHLRDGLMQRLSASLDLGSQAYRPTLLFLNGEFWGIYNIRERYCAEYFESHYGVDPDNVVMLEAVSPLLTGSWNTAYEVNEGNPGDEKDFHDLVTFIENNDMRDNENFAYVESKMDTYNYLDYFIASVFLANTDWPGNNIKVWRNKNPADESGMDTRWRWVLLDMDFGVGLSTSAGQGMLAHAINDNTVCGRIMNRLLRNTTYKMQFIDRCLELMDTVFDKQKTMDTAEQMIAGIDYYIDLNFQRWPGDGGSMSNWDKQTYKIEEFLTKRKDHMLTQLENIMGEAIHTVKVKTDREGVSWTLNGVSSAESSADRYFRHRKVVTIQASAPEGYVVKAMRVHLSETNIKLIEGDTFQGLINKDWKIEVFTAPAQ